jgi:hypothetical protein
MRMSESIIDLTTSLIKAKAEFTAVKRTKTANVTNTRTYKYAELDGVIEAVEEALGKNGLVVMQFPRSDIDRRTVTVLTRLQHTSGQFVEEEMEFPAAGEGGVTPRSMGSAITYDRRYSMLPFLGIAPEDDDGAAANVGVNGQGPKEIVRKSEKAQVGIAANGEPIFDENGEPVVTRQGTPELTQQLQASINQRQQQTSQVPNMLRAVPGKQVGIPRGKRWFAIGMAAGRTKEELNNYLGSIGVERSEEIPVNLYEQACEWADGQ